MRRSCGRGSGVVESSANEGEPRTIPLNEQFTVDPRRIPEDSLNDVRFHYLRYRKQIESSRVEDNKSEWKLNEEENSRTQEEAITRITELYRPSTTTVTPRQRACPTNNVADNLRCSANISTYHGEDLSRSSPGAARFHRRRRIPSYLATLLVLSYTLFGITGTLFCFSAVLLYFSSFKVFGIFYSFSLLFCQSSDR